MARNDKKREWISQMKTGDVVYVGPDKARATAAVVSGITPTGMIKTGEMRFDRSGRETIPGKAAYKLFSPEEMKDK